MAEGADRKAAGRLLMLFITDYFGLKQEAGFSGPEWRSRILHRAGILKDDLSNYTLFYGIQGRTKGGAPHEGIQGFYRLREPVQCTLITLGGLTVCVVENPAVFSAPIGRNPEMCAVCTSVQPRPASLVLLDLLCEHGMLLYAGDFDPEGLVIAQNLKKR